MCGSRIFFPTASGRTRDALHFVDRVQPSNVFHRKLLPCFYCSLERLFEQSFPLSFLVIDSEVWPNVHVRAVLAQRLRTKGMKCSDEGSFVSDARNEGVDALSHFGGGFRRKGQR